MTLADRETDSARRRGRTLFAETQKSRSGVLILPCPTPRKDDYGTLEIGSSLRKRREEILSPPMRTVLHKYRFFVKKIFTAIRGQEKGRHSANRSDNSKQTFIGEPLCLYAP